VASNQLNVLSVVPLIVIPAPSAVVSVGVATEANSIFLSSTLKVVELIVVVVPFTVKSPPTVKLVPIVTLLGNPIVIVSPDIAVSISFDVPETFNVSPKLIVVVDDVSSANVKPEFVKDELVNDLKCLPNCIM
jgi:hypothetical protein